MKISILALASILGISQSYATGGQKAKEPFFDKKSPENRSPSHQDLRKGERGDPSEDRPVLDRLKQKEVSPLPENFWEFEKLEEERQKHADKSHYDSSKEDRGDPLRGTWIDGENEENPLRQSGIWDRETGKNAPQNSLPPLATPSSEARLPQPSPQAPAPQNPEATTPPSEKTIRDAGEWPILTNPTEK
ncbi:MAG: hypothetical protein ACRCYZ_06265 [Alphaproteobacteria bacterium]